MIEKLAKTIFGQKKKKTLSLEESKYHIDEDFIPYVCHYDNNTILTKNGELMQIIRVTGFGNSTDSVEVGSMREKIRDSISQKIKNTNIAFWFTTLRRKKDITPPGKFDDGLAKEFNQEWIKSQKFSDSFVNELYVSIIIEGVDTSISNFSGALKSFSFAATKSMHIGNIKKSHQQLEKISNEFLSDIEQFGAKKLGIIDWEGVLYSEPMRFFGKIINLYEERYPLQMNDISTDLASHIIAFGERELEVLGHNNKNYATMFSLKEYSEISDVNLDHILQLPFEFIITQSFDYATDPKDLEQYKYNDYILSVSDDEEYREVSGLSAMVERIKEDEHDDHDYVKMQTSLMLIAKSKEKLQQDIIETLEHMHDLGLMVIREDVFMEHCFWSQLPGNFTFLRRQKILETELVGGFAMLHSYPSGSLAGNYWGSAIATLKTVIDTPYYFNFHKFNSGHTILLGPDDSGKTVLTNFLLAQSQRIKPKILVLDASNKSQSFIRCLDGKYHNIDLEDGENSCQLNPIKACKNKEQLADLIKSLIDIDDISNVKKEIKNISKICEEALSEKITDFSSLIAKFDNDTTRYCYKNIKKFSNDDYLSKAFAYDEDVVFEDQINAINLANIYPNKIAFMAIICHILNKVENSFNDEPFILVLDEIFDCLDNDFFALKFEKFLKLAAEKNCVVIIKASDIDKILACKRHETIITRLTNFIYMPNLAVNKDYAKAFDLSDAELNVIQTIGHNQKHNFLFKQDQDSIIFDFDLTKINAYLDIFSNSELTLSVLEKLIEDELYLENKDDKDIKVSSILPQFIEQLEDIEKQRIAEIAKNQKQEMLRQKKAIEEKMSNDY